MGTKLFEVKDGMHTVAWHFTSLDTAKVEADKFIFDCGLEDGVTINDEETGKILEELIDGEWVNA